MCLCSTLSGLVLQGHQSKITSNCLPSAARYVFSWKTRCCHDLKMLPARLAGVAACRAHPYRQCLTETTAADAAFLELGRGKQLSHAYHEPSAANSFTAPPAGALCFQSNPRCQAWQSQPHERSQQFSQALPENEATQAAVPAVTHHCCCRCCHSYPHLLLLLPPLLALLLLLLLLLPLPRLLRLLLVLPSTTSAASAAMPTTTPMDDDMDCHTTTHCH